MRNTGEGLTSNDEKMGITKIRQKVISICPFYFQVKSFMSESVSINPPYIGETGMDENIPEILFGSSTATPIDGSEHEGGPYDNSEDNDSTLDEEPEFEDEVLGQQEPHQQSCSQGIPAQREPTPSPSNRSKEPKERKKKPKSF